MIMMVNYFTSLQYASSLDSFGDIYFSKEGETGLCTDSWGGDDEMEDKETSSLAELQD